MMRIFYGWIIIVLLLLVKLLKAPGQANVLAVSTPAISEDLALDPAGFGSTFAAATLTAATLQPFFGAVLDRVGARICLPAGLAALGAGLLLLSEAQGTTGLFASFILLRATAIGCLEAWPNAVISVWFRRWRAAG